MDIAGEFVILKIGVLNPEFPGNKVGGEHIGLVLSKCFGGADDTGKDSNKCFHVVHFICWENGKLLALLRRKFAEFLNSAIGDLVFS